MERQIFVPVQQVGQRNETLYQLCFWGSIIMFFMNVLFAFLLLSFIDGHDYSIISEWIAVILMVLISFACFVSLAMLYTITMNEQSYHALRNVCLVIAGAYLAALSMGSMALLILSMNGGTHHWELFKLTVVPVICEFAVYLTTAYSFYNMYPIKSYFLVPAVSQPVYQPRIYYYS